MVTTLQQPGRRGRSSTTSLAARHSVASATDSTVRGERWCHCHFYSQARLCAPPDRRSWRTTLAAQARAREVLGVHVALVKLHKLLDSISEPLHTSEDQPEHLSARRGRGPGGDTGKQSPGHFCCAILADRFTKSAGEHQTKHPDRGGGKRRSKGKPTARRCREDRSRREDGPTAMSRSRWFWDSRAKQYQNVSGIITWGRTFSFHPLSGYFKILGPFISPTPYYTFNCSIYPQEFYIFEPYLYHILLECFTTSPDAVKSSLAPSN